MEALEEKLGLSTDFDFLKKADPSLLAKFIYGEHPQLDFIHLPEG